MMHSNKVNYTRSKRCRSAHQKRVKNQHTPKQATEQNQDHLDANPSDYKQLKLALQDNYFENVEKMKHFIMNYDFKVPADQLYIIDKVVRNRMRKGRYGKDFSEYINLEHEEIHKKHECHQEMLRSGKTSILIPYTPHSILLKEKLDKSPILQHNQPKHAPSMYKTIRDPKNNKRTRTFAKYGSVQNGKGPHQEDYKDWRMKKRAEDRLRQKLIQQAKDDIRIKV